MGVPEYTFTIVGMSPSPIIHAIPITSMEFTCTNHEEISSEITPFALTMKMEYIYMIKRKIMK